MHFKWEISLIDDNNGRIFCQNQGTFFQFPKKGKGDLPTPPSLVTRLTIIRNHNKLMKTLSCTANKSVPRCKGRSSDISSSYFLRPNEVSSMIHRGSIWASLEQNQINLTATLTIILNLLMFFIIKYVFIIIFTAWSYLQLIYGLLFMRRRCDLECMYMTYYGKRWHWIAVLVILWNQEATFKRR